MPGVSGGITSVVRSLVGVCALALAFGASTAGAAPTLDLAKCLDLTGKSAIPSRKIADNLGVSPDVEREVRSRVSSYDSVRGFEGLDGLGLTPEQTAEVMRRIKTWVAANTREIGAPCPPFKNRTKVIKEVRSLLIYNGYRPAMSFSNPSPRQIRFRAIQDGIEYLGTVVKTAPRQILVSVTSMDARGSSLRVPLKFDA